MIARAVPGDGPTVPGGVTVVAGDGAPAEALGPGVGTSTMRTLPAVSASEPTTAIWSLPGERMTAWGGAASASGAGEPSASGAQDGSASGQAWSMSANTSEKLPSVARWIQATRLASGTSGVAPGGCVATATADWPG